MLDTARNKIIVQQIPAVKAPDNINKTLFLFLMIKPINTEAAVTKIIGMMNVIKLFGPAIINTKTIAVSKPDNPVIIGLLLINNFPFENITPAVSGRAKRGPASLLAMLDGLVMPCI